MRRRDFISFLGGSTLVWPIAAHAQQAAVPVVGFMSSRSADDSITAVAAFRQGLSETGYSESHNIQIDFRWAEGHFERLPALAHELVRRPVKVIVAVGGQQTARTAEAATTSIPIVFGIGEDPVKEGLVPNLNRPAGNMTGVTFFTALLGAKRLRLLRDLAPQADVIGLLVNQNTSQGQSQTRDVRDAARELGVKLVVLNGGSDEEIDASFGSLASQRIGALRSRSIL